MAAPKKIVYGVHGHNVVGLDTEPRFFEMFDLLRDAEAFVLALLERAHAKGRFTSLTIQRHESQGTGVPDEVTVLSRWELSDTLQKIGGVSYTRETYGWDIDILSVPDSKQDALYWAKQAKEDKGDIVMFPEGFTVRS